MLKKVIFLLSLSLSLLFVACGNKDEEETKANVNEYLLTSTDNKQFIVTKELDGFVLEGAKGKVILFDIFATWCPPCKVSASHLTSLQEKFKDDLVIIGLTIEDGISHEALESFKSEYNAQYTIVNSSANRPLINKIAAALGLGERFPIPLMALYIDGKLITHYVGEVQEEFLESDIRRALDK